jgi:hypothetical protein
MTKTISISIPEGLNIEALAEKVWWALQRDKDVVTPEEQQFVVSLLDDLESTASDD